MISRCLLVLLLATLTWSAQASDVDGYQNSWVHQALTLQRGLDHFQPMSRATFLGTHNSYNSSVWSNATRYVDPNQSRSIYDQLRMDVRAMHGWFWDWGKELLMCHGQDNHLGCSSYDRKFRDGLREVRDWIRRPENADEVLLIYIEDHIDGGWYDDAVDDINDMLGQYIYRPAGGCQGIPMDKSKADIIASGKRILLMTDGRFNRGGNPQPMARTVKEEGTIVVGGAANLSDSLTITHDPSYATVPPPEFDDEPLMVLESGSWRRVVQ